jgi:hypothetical protein
MSKWHTSKEGIDLRPKLNACEKEERGNGTENAGDCYFHIFFLINKIY